MRVGRNKVPKKSKVKKGIKYLKKEYRRIIIPKARVGKNKVPKLVPQD